VDFGVACRLLRAFSHPLYTSLIVAGTSRTAQRLVLQELPRMTPNLLILLPRLSQSLVRELRILSAETRLSLPVIGALRPSDPNATKTSQSRRFTCEVF
jgi:hypothetical protein